MKVADVLHFLLVDDESSTHLAAIQARVHQNTKKAESELRRYVLEIQRLVTYKKSLRIATTACKVEDQSFKPGDFVVCDFVSTHDLPTHIPRYCI